VNQAPSFLVFLAAMLVSVGLAAPSAVAIQAPPRSSTEGDIVLMPWLGNDLPIRWEARVGERGGYFVLLRKTRGAFSEVKKIEATYRRNYEVIDQAFPGGHRTYQLRYRNSGGKEYVLATLHITVRFLTPGATGAVATVGSDVPAPLQALALDQPELEGKACIAPPCSPLSEAAEPPTPVPRLTRCAGEA
jgi:hypothetical protein